MSFFSRFKRKATDAGAQMRGVLSPNEYMQHFEDFSSSRIGVEAYYEEKTPRAPSSLLLVANDGEWTRRAVKNLPEAARIARSLEIPFYEVVKTGYPDSMRRYNEKKNREE
ncbi:MAG: oxidoreductase [Actinomycetaceae bacterium]|nr:oxidoreductase [Actinomycetaceae bacterium]